MHCYKVGENRKLSLDFRRVLLVSEAGNTFYSPPNAMNLNRTMKITS